MSAYIPLRIAGVTTGLVQNRQEFILPDDAYPVLENAYVYRETIRRKQGLQIIGRLRRKFTSQSLGSTDVSGNFSGNIFSIFSITEINAQLEVGSIRISDGVNVFTDLSNGILLGTPSGTGTINYETGAITISGGQPSAALTLAFNYFPSLPVMGLRNRDLNSVNNQLTIAFDTTYAYIATSTGWQEYIPGTTWTGDDSEFFWHTNYWVDSSNNKLFWVTNFSGPSGDPIRYTNGIAWTDFTPAINTAGDMFLFQCLCLLPYRNYLVAFNTWEGASMGASVNFPQLIRWSAPGNPIASGAWNSDPGKLAGFISIPTNEQIVSVGFVRDNLVMYCSRSTWQLRYTGRTVQPFQIEKVNSELGAEGTFSTVQFDESLVGIGDKGIVECDSYKSHRMDIKIPNLVFDFDQNTSGSDQNTNADRIQSVRDFINRLAFWTYVEYPPGETKYTPTYPNRRLLYNYENDSWAIFTDSITALGTFYPDTGGNPIDPLGRTWENTQIAWQDCNFAWGPAGEDPIGSTDTPVIMGGNQQGFTFYLDSQVTNDASLAITAITGNTTTATSVTVPNHNLVENTVIKISGIAGTTNNNYTSINDGLFGISIIDKNSFHLYLYNPNTMGFNTPQLNPSQTYLGGGVVAVRDNFVIQSKKFNYVDQGESIQLGYIDLLMPSTSAGAITLQIYPNYNETDPVNTFPSNTSPLSTPATPFADTFFNSIIDTSNPNPRGVIGSKYMQRIYCPVRANFITLVYTLSPVQLVGPEQESNVEIDLQILWLRSAGRFTNQ